MTEPKKKTVQIPGQSARQETRRREAGQGGA
jgi:hypothetical protein